MSLKVPDFSPAQWEFIAATQAFEEPVSVHIIGALVPLSPGEILDLLRKSLKLKWIHRSEEDLFSLTADIPEQVAAVLQKINTPEKIAGIIEFLETKGLVEQVPGGAYARLLQRSGKEKKAIRLEMDMAIEALKKGDKEGAKVHIQQVEALLPAIEGSPDSHPWFIQSAIELSQHCEARAVGFSLVFGLLEKVLVMAHGIGDERSWTIANFLLGRAYWSVNKLQEAIQFLSRGKAKAEELGDSDILTQSAPFVGIYYFIKGLHNQAVPYLEMAVEFAEDSDKYPMNFESPILLAYCDVDRGDFHRAIGKIDFFRHSALRVEDYYIASLYRAVLGIILWLIKKRKESLFHLERSQTDALATQNMVAYWTSLYGLSALYLSEGDIETGLAILKQAIKIAEQFGMGHQIFHSIFLESYATVEQAGWKLPAGWSFNELFERIMREPNIHVQGVALRIRASRTMLMSPYESAPVIKDLDHSEVLLKKCGDPVELAKTHIEKARYYLKQKDTEKARELTYAAYQLMSGYSEVFFPDDLRFLLGDENKEIRSRQEPEDMVEPFVRMLEELIPGPFQTREIDALLSTLSRFFRAERSALFLFQDQKGKNYEIKAARNLSQSIIQAENFRDNLAVIFKSVHEKKPIVIQSSGVRNRLASGSRLSMLCLPLIEDNKVLGVLYFDNSYLDNCFDFIKTPTLSRLGHYLTNVIGNYLRIEQRAASVETTPQMNTVMDIAGNQNIFAEDPNMKRILQQAEKQARSDAAILLMGETGAGKEVLARWIHRMSNRKRNPFVVVDLTTIPENLMESELFGHEKGAFTGADHQKIGRVELAHHGTLFIDEIGEISRGLQTKLLRLLQEKSFVRIGGTKTLISDFRLISATNRNLTEEIAAGRFREDLYYRLNVLELTIPPLRNRKKDILPLARYYLLHYAKKYHVSMPEINQEQESALMEYHWPGNVRELKNVIERAVIVADGGPLEFDFTLRSLEHENNPFADLPSLDEIQRRYIRYVMEHTKGRIGGPEGAAEILGMKRTSVNSRMIRLGLK